MQPRKRKGEAGLDDDVDLVLRHVSRQFAREVARALCDADQTIVEPLGWVETQVTGRQRRLDRALSVKVGDERRLLHAEWTLTMTEEIAFRVFEYHNLTALAAADEARGGRGKPLPIESVVIVLSVGKNRGLRTRRTGLPRRKLRFAGCISGSSPSISAPWPSSRPAGVRSG
ncbi:hypothetical protein [Polyangium jinanense]|uniref:Uncharacterized protein n=1 Tax=Polyangium jinanense TaxID=2829994 RepID=A0A9X4AYA8_9BACT|nr:hypothetical protein [Polyangium jinanense]MDC3956834.1 hypothetical protein [Polyangium jinanense]MDC3987170.1 hypothetical protein [Polyangium jinanense]